MFIDSVMQICDRIMRQTPDQKLSSTYIDDLTGPNHQTTANPQIQPVSSIATVLLVEDETTLLENFRDALEQSGYEVLTASSGESAITICHNHRGRIDVLVSDVIMGRITGFEVASTVKAAHPSVIVILMSGSPISSFPHHGANDDFLEKPFPHQKLLTAISRHTATPSKNEVSR